MKKIRDMGREEARLPRGFRAAGVHAGIKKSGAKDMAMIVADAPATVAGVFTTNQVKAAPVKLDMARVRGGVARAIVVNSGNANACNGARGMRDARWMADFAAGALAVPPEHVLVCSTGTIGLPLPLAPIRDGILMLATSVVPSGGQDAAEAIMTTDTRPKRWTVRFKVGGRMHTVCGMCKGAGMIEPRMATMLAFLTTDARVGAGDLRKLLREAADDSFNRVTVDGDRSTNDTVLFLASGAAGGPRLAPGRPGWSAFQAAVREVTFKLAMMIARDGEGATRFVTIRVSGARSDRDADLAARAVANSFLVKTAWAGPNANWGRVMDALGYSDAKVVEEKVDIRFDELEAVRRGAGGKASREDLKAVIARPEFTVDIRLNLGRGAATVYTCNCTEEYVRINM